jgi:hypothetical protein
LLPVRKRRAIGLRGARYQPLTPQGVNGKSVCCHGRVVGTTQAVMSNVQVQLELEDAIAADDDQRVEEALARGGNPNRVQHGFEPDGPFVFELALRASSPQVLGRLVAGGADLFLAKRDGRPLLVRESFAGDNNERLRWLLDLGCDPNEPDGAGWTALHWSAACGYTENARTLLAAGGDPLLRTRHGLTASDLAERNSHTVTAKLLAAAPPR